MPDAVKTRLANAIKTALQSPTLRQRLADLDITPDFVPAETLQQQLANEIKNWTSLIEAKGLKGN